MTSVIINPTWPKSPGILSAVNVIKKRTQYTSSLASAIAFCAKGSLSHLNQKFGEDFASAQTVSTPGPRQNCSFLGVADGVGGWTKYDIDPSRLSKGILQTMSAQFGEGTSNVFEGSNYSRELATDAYKILRENREYYAGGTTLCFALFNPETLLLRVSNIGDSAAMVVRDGEIVHQTIAGVDGMTPHQLTILPPEMHANAFDFVEDAALNQDFVSEDWELASQDVLIMASDGLFDNLSARDIVGVVQEAKSKPNLKSSELADLIANRLVAEAFSNSENPYLLTPFARRYTRMYGPSAYMGGKPDDITVIVSVVDSDDSARALL